MAMMKYAMMAATALLSVVAAQENTTAAPQPEEDEKEFPLVWVCLGITVVGIVIALYVAYRRPDEFHLPGSTVMVTTENEKVGEGNEPVKKNTLNDDLEAV